MQVGGYTYAAEHYILKMVLQCISHFIKHLWFHFTTKLESFKTNAMKGEKYFTKEIFTWAFSLHIYILVYYNSSVLSSSAPLKCVQEKKNWLSYIANFYILK